MVVSAVMVLGFILAFLISVMFSGAEIAIGSISRDSIEKLMENKVQGAAQIHGIIKNRRRFHLMLLSGRIIAIVSGAFFVFTLILYQGGDLLRQYDSTASWGITNTISLIVIYVVSVAVFIIGEGVLAKLVSMGDYEDTVTRFAYFLGIFYILLFPLTVILDRTLSVFIKRSHELAAKEEALVELVKSESEAGVIEQEEKEMIQGVLHFYDTTVREVMVPRIDMVAVEKDISVDELISLFKKEGHSRIPVYDDRIDHIIGVIYAKDILPIIAEKGKENLSITDTMRKAFYVPETKKISILLKELKKSKVHIAIVVDEYGGTAGIVALEDLLEEIVGEIQDEYDRDERDYLWINERTVLMDAGLDIDDVNEIIHADIPTEDFDTLAGFIYHQLGVIPEGGEEFQWNDTRRDGALAQKVTFTIKEIKGNRISKVLVKLENPLITNRENTDQP